MVLNFWASWCVPCRAELPELVAVYHASEAQGLSVLAVNLTDQERRKDVQTFRVTPECRFRVEVILEPPP